MAARRACGLRRQLCAAQALLSSRVARGYGANEAPSGQVGGGTLAEEVVGGAGRRGWPFEAVNAAPHYRPENNRSASIAGSAVTETEPQTLWISFFNTNPQSDQTACAKMAPVSSYGSAAGVLRPP